MGLFLGVDVGTSSTKGVLVSASGAIVAQAVRQHQVQRPRPGWAEMDATLWWSEFVSVTQELLGELAAGPRPMPPVTAVGVSGMGPCVLVTDADDEPLRPAILYGVDTRAVPQIARLREQLGDHAVLDRCGSLLSTQAVGPKLAWLAEEEPEVFARARRLYMPASWLVRHLTDEYTLDHHAASQAVPLYDGIECGWYRPWIEEIMPALELPRLGWGTDVAGRVSAEAAAETGLPVGAPVVFGTIDAWTEAVSADAHRVGDLMVMYGTTMVMVHTVPTRIVHPALWATVGALPHTRNLAAGMATSGAITEWMRGIFGASEYGGLLAAAAAAPPGAEGLICLPYFSGERTPIADPLARGVLIGLTTSHSQGHLYRAALEATAMGARHNIEAFADAGGRFDRIVAVGGGTAGGLWTQIVSDVCGLQQVVPSVTIGASFGAARLAAMASGVDDSVDWNPPQRVVDPRPELADRYDDLYGQYRKLYRATRDIQHTLAGMQES